MPPGAITVKVPLPRVVLPPSKLREADAVWLTTTALGPLLRKTMPFPAVLPKWLLGLFRRIGKLPALKNATPLTVMPVPLVSGTAAPVAVAA